MTTSVIDYIFRERAISYLERYDLAHLNENNNLRATELSRPVKREKEKMAGEGKIEKTGEEKISDSKIKIARSSGIYGRYMRILRKPYNDP